MQIVKNLWIVIILVVSSCRSVIDNQISILQEASCDLPCWNNIIPGQTTEKEAIQVISDLSIVHTESIRIANEPWNIFDNQIDFSFGDADNTADVYVSDGEVKMLYMWGSLNTTISCSPILLFQYNFVKQTGHGDFFAFLYRSVEATIIASLAGAWTGTQIEKLLSP